MYDNAKFTIDVKSFEFDIKKMNQCLYPEIVYKIKE